jgi:uncharacterized protein (TIGR03086 family)
LSLDWFALQGRANAGFTRTLTAVGDWDAPEVRRLVTHVVEEQQWVPHLLAGRTVQQARLDLEPLRDDLPAEWELYSFAAAAAWRSVDAAAPVRLAADTVPAIEYLHEQVAEIAIHTWDLARAIGADDRLDEQLVDGVWTLFEPQRRALLEAGVAAIVPDQAPLQDRLLALTGRTASGAQANPRCALIAA